MEKRIGSRAFFGFCCGVTIGVAVCILISAVLGDGEYMPTVPILLAYCGSELNTVLITTLWTGIIGVTFAEAALVFEVAKWGILRQYLTHFLITGVVYLPFLFITNWFGNSLTLLGIAGNIVLTYGIAWGIQHSLSVREVSKINAALERRRHERN